MYHVTKSCARWHAVPGLWVSPADFRGQMAWLADNGYTGITMAQLFKYWDEGFKLPEKPVVISFDDGYPSHAKSRARCSRRTTGPACCFLELRTSNPGDRLEELRWSSQLIASGWEIGSHTISHPDLTSSSRPS